MAQKFSGGCACGAICHECSADPALMFPLEVGVS